MRKYGSVEDLPFKLLPRFLAQGFSFQDAVSRLMKRVDQILKPVHFHKRLPPKPAVEELAFRSFFWVGADAGRLRSPVSG